MSFSYSQYKAVVQHILGEQGRKKDLDAAIKKAAVPKHMVELIRNQFEAPVEITAPSLLKEDRNDKLDLCLKPDGSFPEPYFNSFSDYLLDHRHWSKAVIDNLAVSSTSLVTRLPQPKSGKAYQYRGLVVGHIQSGKTASMAALIARAADQGYKLFIVMSGLYHDLRSQTQSRMDQEITGQTDNPSEEPVVSHEPGVKWVRLTQSGLSGEFQAGSISSTGILTHDAPKLAVIKKNARVLERLFTWLRDSQVDLAQLPALVIDDEADQASINTNANKTDEYGDKIDPSKTNKRILELLKLLPKCVYVGYTATPFANVLIDSTSDDLYPRDFIAVLPEPEGYLGPRQLFGLGMSSSELSPHEPQPAHYNVIRIVNEELLAELDTPNPDGVVPALLKDSMLAFLLSSCARMERGQHDQHFSMLVHPSVRTAEHMRYAEVIRKEIRYILEALQRPRQFAELAKRAKEMWEKDFEPATRAIPEGKKLVRKFEDIWGYAKTVASQIEVKVLNSGSEDELEYDQTPKRYIVVGGARLSRGLTLQGLSVSVFLRDSKEYDTLLQMGRWFGYRRNYGDLTRIYVEESRAEDFASLARIEQEMREDLGKYAKEPDPPSPREVFPRIRSHHRMAVTSVTKRGAGQSLNVSFSGKLGQTVSFPFDEPAWLRENEAIVHTWLKDLGKPAKIASKAGSVWLDVKPEVILDLLKDFHFSRYASVVNGAHLSNYIKYQNTKGELVTWDVIVPKGSDKVAPYKWTETLSGHKVKRGLVTPKSIQTLSDHREDLWAKTLERDPSDKKRGVLYLYAIDGTELRKDAHKNWGKKLAIPDVIGMVLQFPESKSAATAEYFGQGGTQ